MIHWDFTSHKHVICLPLFTRCNYVYNIPTKYTYTKKTCIIINTVLHVSPLIAPSSGRTLSNAENYHCILTFCWPCIPVYLSQYLTNLMHKICFTISFISCLYMFRAHVLIIRRSKLHYTACGIITPIGGLLVHETACEQAVNTAVWHITLLCVHWKTPDDGRRNCTKHVEFYSKNKIWEFIASSSFYYKKGFLTYSVLLYNT